MYATHYIPSIVEVINYIIFILYYVLSIRLKYTSTYR